MSSIGYIILWDAICPYFQILMFEKNPLEVVSTLLSPVWASKLTSYLRSQSLFSVQKISSIQINIELQILKYVVNSTILTYVELGKQVNLFLCKYIMKNKVGLKLTQLTRIYLRPPL